MTAVLVFIFAVVLLLVAAFFVSRFLFKRAVRQVVFLFRKRAALDPKSAKTLDELGLVRGGIRERLFRPRDYRPYALRLLGQANVLKEITGGRVYLSEDELENSPVKKFARVKGPGAPIQASAPNRPPGRTGDG